MKTITTACVNHKGGVAKTTSLLNLAAGGRLRDPAILDREARRMMADAKADASGTMA